MAREIGGAGNLPSSMPAINSRPDIDRTWLRSKRSSDELAKFMAALLAGGLYQPPEGPQALLRNVLESDAGGDPQGMADVAGELRAVERVEMEPHDASSKSVLDNSVESVVAKRSDRSP